MAAPFKPIINLHQHFDLMRLKSGLPLRRPLHPALEFLRRPKKIAGRPEKPRPAAGHLRRREVVS